MLSMKGIEFSSLIATGLSISSSSRVGSQEHELLSSSSSSLNHLIISSLTSAQTRINQSGIFKLFEKRERLKRVEEREWIWDPLSSVNGIRALLGSAPLLSSSPASFETNPGRASASDTSSLSLSLSLSRLRKGRIRTKIEKRAKL
jgi:hypothetical protein